MTRAARRVGVCNLHRYDEERLDWLTRFGDHYEGLSKVQ